MADRKMSDALTGGQNLPAIGWGPVLWQFAYQGVIAAVLLGAGAPGKRAALPNSRVLIHQPATQGTQGQVSDLEIQAAEIERMRKLMETTLSEHTGRTAEQIRIDTDRDKILTAQEAVEYGIIDTVFDYRKLNA